eukprot:CAMPEP_0176355426 /NCGR_PEP_ID=MMETSP0126-20121128/13287_1 /TAXON_ID=141414 ORGANISM="Strombidinopsis acuminatum, Strain SPMC142" /NCGR_SAMPLE_ID=MMETSP0126 /ASSEMBLY_ACC=CAM_ASM_000229 /LENGTH=82 /DNA_ID=CAMNT_0017708073 /DNA_START=636 /DNA_END=882 /DNA_ORIENTATION=+
MSWSFILVFGLNGLIGLLMADSKSIQEMEAMATGAAMMQQGNPMQQKNFTQLFKAEKDNYEILNYKSTLDDAEDAFLLKFYP